MPALERARKVLQTEIDALAAMMDRLNDSFNKAFAILLGCKGKVVVVGMGKSGLVGAKIAATLASTGTPSFFLHAAEAMHGDLGMVYKNDVALVISNSGETDEILAILPAMRRLGLPIVAMTGNLNSRLAGFADVTLDTHVAEEACPLGLAPTASTTVQMAMGDALAVALLEERGFSEEDFARVHPAGVLGKRLLVKVDELMHAGDEVPRVREDTPMTKVLLEMSAKRLGLTVVEDAHGHALGVISDGDLRRAMQKFGELTAMTAVQIMTTAPKAIPTGMLASRAAFHIETNRISALLVHAPEDPRRIVGVVHIHDLMQAGIV